MYFWKHTGAVHAFAVRSEEGWEEEGRLVTLHTAGIFSPWSYILYSSFVGTGGMAHVKNTAALAEDPV